MRVAFAKSVESKMSQWQVLFLSLLLLYLYIPSRAYRILIVYPAPSFSHQQIQQAVSKGLAAAGHELVIITPGPSKELNSHANVTQIDASFLFERFQMGSFVQTNTPREFMLALQEIYPKTIDDLLSMKEVQALITDRTRRKFDAVIFENLGFTTPFFMFAEMDDAALIGLSSLEMLTNYYAALGNIRHPLLHSGNFAPVPNNPTFWQRLKSVYENMVMYYWEEQEYSPAFDYVIKKHFKTDRTSNELIRRMNFAIEGVSPLTGYARPLLPNVVQVGFLHVEQKIHPLPSDIDRFLSRSKHGVIYCSFGTNVKANLVDLNLVESMVRTFSDLKYDILWKFDGMINNSYNNIKVVNWAPQQDILGHANVKLFITQGGAQSRDESVARGVPLLVIPFFADQFDTAYKVEEIGVGQMLRPEDATPELLSMTIKDILENDKYRKRSKEIARAVVDVPMSPVETAVYWIEYVIRNRNVPAFQYKGRDMPLYQYFLLDVIAFGLTWLLFVIIVAYWIVKKLQEPKVVAKSTPTKKKTKTNSKVKRH